MKRKHRSHKKKAIRKNARKVPAAVVGQTVAYSDLKIRRRSPKNAPYLGAIKALKEGQSHVIPIAKGDKPENSYARIWSSMKIHIGPAPAGFVRSMEQVEMPGGGRGWAVSLKRKARKSK